MSLQFFHPNQKYPTGRECANCGEPIYYGENWITSYVMVSALDTSQNAQVQVPATGFEKPAHYHLVCSARFAHDVYTKTDCDQDKNEIECAGCGVAHDDDDCDLINGHYYCSNCTSKLSGTSA
jgi:formylmethanofuran dehydrogenase subunit E